MVRRIIVGIKAASLGKIKEEIQIVTKSDVFKLPVEAQVMAEADFQAQA